MRGKVLADAPDRRNRQSDRRRRHRAEEDRAALAGLQVGDLAVDLAQFEQHRAGAPGQRLAIGRQLDAARQPLAERHAQNVFHLGDHARRRRLRDVQNLRGRADLAGILDRHDHAHVRQLQPAVKQRVTYRPPAADLRCCAFP